jgi:hypothetical protein
MMKNHEKDLLQATKGAQGNGALLAAIERLNLAAKQNAPWMFFNLKALPPDLQSFEKDARTAAVLVHPDKNQDHLETAEILIKIHNDIVTWIKQKHYQS